MATYEEVYGRLKEKNPGASEKELSEGALLIMGQEKEQPQAQAQAAEPTFRQKFSGVMDRLIGDPLAWGVEKLTAAGMPSSREPVVPGGPSTARMTGEAFKSVVPNTPEGVVMSALPFTRPGAAMMATGPRALATMPLVGAGTAYASKIPDEGLLHAPGVDEAIGFGQGLVQGGTVAATRGLQRLGRRVAGSEISARDVVTPALDEVKGGTLLAEALGKEAGIPLSGPTGAAKIRTAPKVIQDAISTDYQSMQNVVEGVAGTQTFNLPTLGWVRGKTRTIPGTPGKPAVPSRTGHPAQPAVPGTPAQTVQDDTFSAHEAMEFMKNFSAKVRDAQRRAVNKGEPLLAKNPTDLNRAARDEIRSAITNIDPQAAQQFDDASAFYARGMRVKKLVEDALKAGVLTEAGTTTEGGVNQKKLSQFLMTAFKQDPGAFPHVFEAGFRGQNMGARALQRPGIGGGQRAYTPGMGFQIPSLPGTTIPIGQEMQISGLPSRLTGAATLLGTEYMKPKDSAAGVE